MKIPFIKLTSPEKDSLLEGILSEFKSVYQSSSFILGKKVEEFESKFKRCSETQYAIGVNSGLDALILSLKALGIGPGDEVITVPNSFIASASAIELVGARPVFVDADLTYNIDVEKVEDAITRKTKARGSLKSIHLRNIITQMLHSSSRSKNQS